MHPNVAVIFYRAAGAAGDGPDSAVLAAARYQGRRLADVTARLTRGRAAEIARPARGKAAGDAVDTTAVPA